MHPAQFRRLYRDLAQQRSAEGAILVEPGQSRLAADPVRLAAATDGTIPRVFFQVRVRRRQLAALQAEVVQRAFLVVCCVLIGKALSLPLLRLVLVSRQVAHDQVCL
jgi:hypothetical protein